MVRLSFGPGGEFFIEINEEITDAVVDVSENLYRRIMTARSEMKILEEAMREANEESNGG